MAPKKVCIVGSGNWGSAIARLVGANTARFPERFVKDVNMWVFEEEVDGRKLTEIINTEHENVKYLPGRPLPLKMGDNTKAAIIRLGLKEMIKYGDTFYPGGDHATYFESCGVADLITTCYGGRNRKVSEAFVVRKKSIVELESDMLNGQKLQGPETAAEVNHMLASKGLEAEFPLFTAVHKVCLGELEPEQLIGAIKNHPAHV